MIFRSHPWPRVGAAVPLAMALAALFAIDARPAAACSCAQPPEPDVAMADADVVFEGTPRAQQALEADIGFLDYRGAVRFDFEVARYFKGQLGPELALFTVDQSSACGRSYAIDEPHIIYARYSESGLLTDFACSRSHPSRAAGAEAAVLGSGVAPDPAVVSGDDGSVDAAPEAPGVSSGIHHVPLAAEPDASGCASTLAQRPPPGGRPWLAPGAGLALLALRLRRRAAR